MQTEQIFISWFSPDRAAVTPVIDRLTYAGMKPMEYSHDPAQGDAGDLVNGYIKRSRLALFFISEESVTRDWMAREVAWVYKERRDRADRGQVPPAVLPVLLGMMPTAGLPGEMADHKFLRRLEFPDARLGDAEIAHIVEAIVATLGTVPPRVIPVALLAMTKAEAEGFLPTLKDNDDFKQLCSAVGMHGFPELSAELLSRYRDNSDDFSPFEGETSLKQIIDGALERVNVSRPRDSSRLWLWWSTVDQLNGYSPHNPRLRRYVGDGASIVILDAVSMCDEGVRNKFVTLPPPGPKGRRAVLWVPPYTRHTSRLHQLTQSTMRGFVPLLALFENWGMHEVDPAVPFDIATVATLQSWVYNAVRAIEGASAPLSENTSAIAELFANAPKRAPHIGVDA